MMQGVTSLMHAAMEGRKEVVEMLLAAGAVNKVGDVSMCVHVGM